MSYNLLSRGEPSFRSASSSLDARARRRPGLIAFVAGWSVLAVSTIAGAQTSQLVTPVAGATQVPTSVTFQWSAVVGAPAYYLYVGTAVGLNDVVNTGEIPGTDYTAASLPDNRTLYARIWNNAGDVWRYTDSMFTTLQTRATLTAPVSSAFVEALPLTVQWTAVPNAQAYYLYVGTTAGSRDIVDTGEIFATSLVTRALPPDTTLHLRLHTKLAGVWRWSDSTVTTTGTTASLISPTEGSSVPSVASNFRWGPVANAQAYYLYVGTSPGAKDVVNSGELQGTTYTAARLASDRTLYVRLHTRRGNVWRYVDSTVITNGGPARIVMPVDGTDNVALTAPIEWSRVPGAEAYYLYVGTTDGAKDIVDTGEIHATRYTPAGWPSDRTLFVRVWTRVGGQWQFSATKFSTLRTSARLINPLPDSQVFGKITFNWNAVPGAEAYYLVVGTGAGLRDVLDSGETQDLTQFARLPERQRLFARLYTRWQGVWRYSDVEFSTIGRFIYPLDKAIAVDLGRAIEWAPIPGADAYRLYVSAGSDGSGLLLDSGVTAGTSVSGAGLPADRVLYTRLMFRINATWRFADIVFTAQRAVEASRVQYPADGTLDVIAGVPFQWSAVPVAEGYRLRVGTFPGGTDVYDSGVVMVTRRLVEGMPTGRPLYGSLGTRLGGEWSLRTFQFSVTEATVSTAQRTQFAHWADGEVRSMANMSNVTTIGSRLAWLVSDHDASAALCTDYAEALIGYIGELEVGLPVRYLNVAFHSNRYDVHSLTELLDPDTGRWGILDPTFGLAVRRTSDGAWATAEDLQIATTSRQWSDLSYVWHTSSGDRYARNYYIDYPLLFLTIMQTSGVEMTQEGPSPASYLEAVPMPHAGEREVYVVQCDADAASADLVVDGVLVSKGCLGNGGLSVSFWASSVQPAPAGNAALLFRLRRFLF